MVLVIVHLVLLTLNLCRQLNDFDIFDLMLAEAMISAKVLVLALLFSATRYFIFRSCLDLSSLSFEVICISSLFIYIGNDVYCSLSVKRNIMLAV